MFKFMVWLLIPLLLVSCVTTHKNTHENSKKNETKQTTKQPKSSYKVKGKQYHVMKSGKNYQAKGVASWYGRGFHRKKTSSGERFNMYNMTAAHKTLPLSTYVLVTNLVNGRKVVVKVNDRGPFVSNRLIDLSYGAAKKIGMVGQGVAPVSIKAIG